MTGCTGEIHPVRGFTGGSGWVQRSALYLDCWFCGPAPTVYFSGGFLVLFGFRGAVDAVAELLQELQHVGHAETALVARGAVTVEHVAVGVAADGGRADTEDTGRLFQGELRIEQTA